MSKHTKAYIISGNTYVHHYALKDEGAKWDAERKAWVLPNGTTMAGRARVSAVVQRLRDLGLTVEEAP